MEKADSIPQKLKRKIALVVYLPTTPFSACAEIRLVSPLRHLFLDGKITMRLGADFSRVDQGEVAFNLGLIDNADMVVLQRELFDMQIGERIIKEAKQHGKLVVYEVDDLLVDLPSLHPGKSWYAKVAPVITNMMAKADAVTVTTPKLRDQLLKYNPNIYLLPNYIDANVWLNVKPARTIEEKRLVIGYMGTSTHERDLEVLEPVIKQILTKYGNSVVVSFWGCITDELRRVEGIKFIQDSVNDYRKFAALLQGAGFGIALAPLLKNTFNECKSNIKFLEYSICKVAGVYSDITPYSDTVVNGVTGMLVDDDPRSWYAANENLIEDKALRLQIAENAYQKVISEFMIEKNAQKWFDLYSMLLEQKVGQHKEQIVSTCQQRQGASKSVPRYTFSLLPAKRQGMTLMVALEDGTTKFLHSRYDPEDEARCMVDAFQFDGQGILVVLGLGLGYHVREFFKRYKNVKIFVVEPVPEIFELAKTSGLISDFLDRATFLVGCAPCDLVQEINKSAGKTVPISLFPLSSSINALSVYYDSLTLLDTLCHRRSS